MAEEDIDEEAGVEVGAGVLMVVGYPSDETGAPGVAIDMDLIHHILVAVTNQEIITTMSPTDLLILDFLRSVNVNVDVAMIHLLVCRFLYETLPVISVFQI